MFEYLTSSQEFCPSVGPPPAPETHSVREQIHFAANTALMLGEDEVTEEDEGRARALFESGQVPSAYERSLPGVMRKLDALLTEYDYSFLEEANRIRNYVTNRLLEESDDPDPKIRMRAYELLGKVTEVGLFTERTEVTITNRSTEEIETLLREKLQSLTAKVINPDPPPTPTLDVRPEDLFDE